MWNHLSAEFWIEVVKSSKIPGAGVIFHILEIERCLNGFVKPFDITFGNHFVEDYNQNFVVMS